MTTTASRADRLPVLPGERLPRVESLTGLRWWAAFFVFAHHMTNLAPLPIHDFLQYGTSGVTFFFVLSGFVLTWSAQAGLPTRTFYWRRFARIWPAHAVALLLAVFVFYRVSPDPAEWWIKPLDLGILLLCLVLMHAWSNDPAILYGGNPASWTLSVEAFFYAYHPFAHRALSRLRTRGGLAFCALVLALGAGYRVAAYRWPEAVPVLSQPVLHSVAFLVGIGLAVALRAGWRPQIPVWAAFAVFGAGLFTIWYAGNHPSVVPLGTTLGLTHKEVLTALYGFVIVAVASRDLRGGRSWLRSRPLVALGHWSYAFYLVHATLLYAIREVSGSVRPVGWTNVAWYAVICALAVLASWLHYRFIEHPLERRLRHRGPRGLLPL